VGLLVPEVSPQFQFLYHASDKDFNLGDVVTPVNYNHAFATKDKSLAKEYGKNIYKVEPVDREEADSYTSEEAAKWVGDMPEDSKSIVKSKKGFKVVSKESE
jgi:hypothetical protein